LGPRRGTDPEAETMSGIWWCAGGRDRTSENMGGEEALSDHCSYASKGCNGDDSLYDKCDCLRVTFRVKTDVILVE